MFAIRFARGAVAELRRLRAFDRVRLLDEVAKHLQEHPTRHGGRKKVLIGLVPPWEQVRPVWQLRVGDYRFVYDVDEGAREVVVQAVRRKPRGTTTKEIL